jgi:hypothetical protein
LEATEGPDDTSSPLTRATSIDPGRFGGFLVQKEFVLPDHKKDVGDASSGRTRTIMDVGTLCVL